jgi:hypothetical protein
MTLHRCRGATIVASSQQFDDISAFSGAMLKRAAF